MRKGSKLYAFFLRSGVLEVQVITCSTFKRQQGFQIHRSPKNRAQSIQSHQENLRCFCLVTQLEYVLLLWLPWFKKYCKNKTRNSLEVQTQTKWLVFSTIHGARISYILLYQMGKPFWSTFGLLGNMKNMILFGVCWRSFSLDVHIEILDLTMAPGKLPYNQHITCVRCESQVSIGTRNSCFRGYQEAVASAQHVLIKKSQQRHR